MSTKTIVYLISIYNAAQVFCMEPPYNKVTEMSKGHCPGSVDELIERVRCEPRPTLVRIDKETRPNVFLVNRCAGMCGGECLPVVKRIVTFSAFSEYHFDFRTCKNIPVEEHLACKCDKPSHRHCTNQEDYASCIQPNKRWSQEKCACVCKGKKCSTFSSWDEESCKCIRHPRHHPK